MRELNIDKTPNMHALLEKYFTKYGITNENVKAAAIGIIMSEGQMTGVSEGMYYKTPGRLAEVWSTFSTYKNPKTGKIERAPKGKGNEYTNALAESGKYVENPKALGNFIYGNRLGNKGRDTDDGYTYRGRGPNQLTGRGSYKKLGKKLGVDLEKYPELLNTDPDIQAHATVRFLHDRIAVELPKLVNNSSKYKKRFGEYVDFNNIDNLKDASFLMTSANAGFGNYPQQDAFNKRLTNAKNYVLKSKDPNYIASFNIDPANTTIPNNNNKKLTTEDAKKYGTLSSQEQQVVNALPVDNRIEYLNNMNPVVSDNTFVAPQYGGIDQNNFQPTFQSMPNFDPLLTNNKLIAKMSKKNNVNPIEGIENTKFGSPTLFRKYGGQINMPYNNYKYGAGMRITSDILGGLSSLAGNIPGIGTAVGAGLGTLAGTADYYSEQAAASEDGKVSLRDTDLADLGTKMAFGAGKGATGSIGTAVIGLGEQGLDEFTTTEAEKQEAEYARILQDPNDPLYAETLEREQRKQKANRGTGLVSQAINIGTSIASGQMEKGSLGDAGSAAFDVTETGAEDIVDIPSDMARYGGTIYRKGGQMNPSDFTTHMMYKDGKGVTANSYQEHMRLKNAGYGHSAEYGGNMYNDYTHGSKMYNGYTNMHQIDPNMRNAVKPTGTSITTFSNVGPESLPNPNAQQYQDLRTPGYRDNYDTFLAAYDKSEELARMETPKGNGHYGDSVKDFNMNERLMQLNFPNEFKDTQQERLDNEVATYGVMSNEHHKRKLRADLKSGALSQEDFNNQINKNQLSGNSMSSGKTSGNFVLNKHGYMGKPLTTPSGGSVDTQNDLVNTREQISRSRSFIDEFGLEEFNKRNKEYSETSTLIDPKKVEAIGTNATNELKDSLYVNPKFNYGGNMYNDYAYGGSMYSNDGFGDNNMNQIPVNEFGAGGTHEENPLGGIPQGMGPNGAPNLVEEGEIKIPDPRDPNASFIVSAQPDMKITKKLAEEKGLPKKYVNKTVLAAAKMLLRNNDVFTREGDSITDNSINQDLIPFMETHEALTAMKEAKEEESFNAEMNAIAEKYPQQMQGAMQQEPMQQMPEGQMMPEMSEEEMMMMQQQGDPQQMPMARYGGKRKKKKNSYAYGSEMKSEYYTLGGGMPQYGAPNTQSNTGMAVPTSAGMNPNMEMNPKMMNQNPAVSNMNQMDQMNQMNQGMRLGGNIHQYTPNMENIPIFDTEEEINSRMQDYSLIQEDYESIPDYLQYDSSQGPMFGQLEYGLTNSTIPAPGGYYTKEQAKKLLSNDQANQANQAIAKEKSGGAAVIPDVKDNRIAPGGGAAYSAPSKNVKDAEYQESLGTAAGKMLPIAYNLGMGLFGKTGDIDLSRLDPKLLNKYNFSNQLNQAKQSFALASKNVRQNSTAGNYLGNMTALNNSFNDATSKIYAQKYNTDLAIDNQNVKTLNTADKINKGKEDAEKMYNENAKGAKNEMLTTAIEQLAENSSSKEKNELAGKYNAMYAEDYTFDYNTYLDRFSKILKDKKAKKKNKKDPK